MSVKGRPHKSIHISSMNHTEDHRIPPLTREGVLERLEFYGSMIPLYNHDKRWFKFALKRMDELNERLKDFQKHNRVAA